MTGKVRTACFHHVAEGALDRLVAPMARDEAACKLPPTGCGGAEVYLFDQPRSPGTAFPWARGAQNILFFDHRGGCPEPANRGKSETALSTLRHADRIVISGIQGGLMGILDDMHHENPHAEFRISKNIFRGIGKGIDAETLVAVALKGRLRRHAMSNRCAAENLMASLASSVAGLQVPRGVIDFEAMRALLIMSRSPPVDFGGGIAANFNDGSEMQLDVGVHVTVLANRPETAFAVKRQGDLLVLSDTGRRFAAALWPGLADEAVWRNIERLGGDPRSEEETTSLLGAVLSAQRNHLGRILKGKPRMVTRGGRKSGQSGDTAAPTPSSEGWDA